MASHGDFINIRLGISNDVILNDSQLREKCNITLEAYDNSINQYVIDRHADQILLDNFSEKVKKSVYLGCPIIMALTHPRNWKVDYCANTIDNIGRLVEGIKYRVKLR